MTLDQQVSDLTDSTNALLASVAAKKPTLDGYLTTLSGSAATSATSAATANTSYLSAVTSSNSAQLSTDLAQAAWNSTAAPNESLAAMNKTFFTSNAIVAAIIYDTKKDSDGGAWRKRCQATSWYNETVYGNYLGEADVELTARCTNAVLGSNLISNGNFASGSTGWVLNTGWSVSNGLAINSGSSVNISQNVLITPGTTYVVEFDATILAGGLCAEFNSTIRHYQYQSGHYRTTFTPSANATLYIYGGGFVGSITNVSFKPLVSYTTQTNDFFHNTTDGLFYALNATSGVTQIYRGNRREFPEVVAITAEAGRVIIWDLTDSSVPMWMVFVGGTSYIAPIYDWNRTGRTITSLAASNGKLFHGATTSWGVGISDFIKDKYGKYGVVSGAAYCGWAGGNLSNRITGFPSMPDGALPAVLGDVNSIAATILPTSPIDPATGLPVPTIAVFTAGGVSVIKDDGTVVNSANASSASFGSFYKNGDLLWSIAAGAIEFFAASPIAAGFGGTRYNGGNATIPATSGLSASKRIASASYLVLGSQLLEFIKENPTTPASGMVATITNTYNTGWMNGDIRLAALADTAVETVSGTELVTNGTFNTDVSGWIATVSGGGSVTWDATGKLKLTMNGVWGDLATQSIPTVIGKTYRLSFSGTSGTVNPLMHIGITSGGNQIAANLTVGFTFVAITTTTWLTCSNNLNTAGTYALYDNISVTECAADRSVKANPITVYGQLTKSNANTSNNLVSYSNFSMKNYLEQPYSANLDYGTGDFYYGFWGTFGGPGWDEYPWSRTSTAPVIGDVQLKWNGAASPSLEWFNGTAWAGVVACSSQVLGTSYHKIEVLRRSGVAYMYVDGAQVATAAFTGSVSSASPFRVGNSLSPSSAVYSLSYHTGSLALLRSSATAPSADQIAYMYETERKLFEPGAQCTIDGTSSAVTALAYDEVSDLLHVGTTWGRSAFKGLTRISSEAATNGTVVSYAVNDSDILTVGATGAKLLVPSTVVKDELMRKYEQKKQFGQKLVGVDFDAIAAQTTFTLPLNFKARSVTSNGNTMRLGSAKDYTITNDGFRDSIVFNVAPGAGAWVNVQCTRTL